MSCIVLQHCTTDNLLFRIRLKALRLILRLKD